MSVFSDASIRRLIAEGRVKIEPWDESMVQPASVDLRLGPSFRVFHNFRVEAIDLLEPPTNLTEHVTIEPDEPFVIHPGEFVLGRTEEHVEIPDDIVARIEGKALALDTEVPTPSGWTTMGELEVGDVVFAIDGRPVPVVAATDAMADRECREVLFSDGTSIVCDLDHQWPVRTKYDQRIDNPWRVMTTREIERRGVLEGKERQFKVPLAEPALYPSRALPIGPYTLGAWIGDGTTTKGEITTADREILDCIESAGYALTKASGPIAFRIGAKPPVRDVRTGRFAANGSFHSELRTLGVLGHKRVPAEYLQASYEDRRALLDGLMDTDGYVDKLGRCDITTISRELADGYRELIASLGFRPIVATKRAKLYGRGCGPRYEVTFTPDRLVFQLPRKHERQHLRQRFETTRSIAAINPVPSVPVRCIQVGHPDGVFLVTRSFIPTHNSSLGRLGLIVHATAGFVDPGFKGTLTLEITNLTRVPIKLWAGKPIAQLSFMALDRAAERPYGHPELGSHYHGQVEATESRYEGGPGAGRRG